MPASGLLPLPLSPPACWSGAIISIQTCHPLQPVTPALQVLFAWELQRRTGGEVVSVSVHPGEVITNVVRSLPSVLQRAYQMLLKTILLSPAQGGVGFSHLEMARNWCPQHTCP